MRWGHVGSFGLVIVQLSVNSAENAVLHKASRLGVMPCGMPGKLARLPKAGDINEVYLRNNYM